MPLTRSTSDASARRVPASLLRRAAGSALALLALIPSTVLLCGCDLAASLSPASAHAEASAQAEADQIVEVVRQGVELQSTSVKVPSTMVPREMAGSANRSRIAAAPAAHVTDSSARPAASQPPPKPRPPEVVIGGSDSMRDPFADQKTRSMLRRQPDGSLVPVVGCDFGQQNELQAANAPLPPPPPHMALQGTMSFDREHVATINGNVMRITDTIGPDKNQWVIASIEPGRVTVRRTVENITHTFTVTRSKCPCPECNPDAELTRRWQAYGWCGTR